MAPPKGWMPPNAGKGRKPGSRNKAGIQARAHAEQVRQAIIQAIPDAFTGGAHDFLQSVYRNPNLPLATRIDAAGKAVRYETPALSSTEQKHSGSIDVATKTREQLQREIAEDAAALGARFVALAKAPAGHA